jgi:hypothetical protein
MHKFTGKFNIMERGTFRLNQNVRMLQNQNVGLGSVERQETRIRLQCFKGLAHSSNIYLIMLNLAKHDLIIALENKLQPLRKIKEKNSEKCTVPSTHQKFSKEKRV